ncbi:HDOD domain-containing protein [Endothiovibrio diazotrophicus]
MAQTAGREARNTLDQWAERFTDRDMPIFADTARRITGLTVQDDASLTELVQTILRDSLMTARVLKVANSVYYQPGRGAITTVSRAVVVMGFETVRALALSVSLVESLGEGMQRERVSREVARAFHAALHAKTFAVRLGDEHPEEVYAAALLHRVGHIAFACFGGEASERLEEQLRRNGGDHAAAERTVLGFPLDELSGRLGKSWRLGDLFEQVTAGGDTPRAHSIALGHAVAEAAEAGWEARRMEPLLGKLSELLKMPAGEVASLVYANARNAAANAGFMGLGKVGSLIPEPPKPEALGQPEEADGRLETLERSVAEQGLAEPADDTLVLDHARQLKMLWELATLLEGEPNLNMLLPMVLEGIHRGVGMDRTLLALVDSKRGVVAPKYVLGDFDEERVRGMEFSVRPGKASLFSYALESRNPVWATGRPEWELAAMYTLDIKILSKGSPFYLMPICVDDRSIGLAYADCHSSGRALTEEGFLAFQHFVRQVNIAFSMISLRSAGRSRRVR